MVCGKIYFENKRKAKAKKRAYENKYGKKIDIYKCKNCGGFHYTTHGDIETKKYFRRVKEEN